VREDIFKPTIGNESLHQVGNDNGVRILNFATSRILVVKSMMFLHRNIRKYTWTESCCLFPVVVIGHICCTHIHTTCHPCPTSQPNCQFQVCRLDCNPHSSVCEWYSDPLYRWKQLSYLHFAHQHYSSVAWRCIMWGLEHGCQHFQQHLIFFLLWPSDTSNFQAGPSVWTAITVGGHRSVCVTLDTQLVWVTHTHHIGHKAVQRLGLLSIVL
jgi:hypothetical protein